MATPQIVIGNQMAEVVNVVIADIDGEPVYNSGQFKKTAALHARIKEIPLFLISPIGVLILVLHIKKIKSGYLRHQGSGQMYQQQRLPTHQPTHEGNGEGNKNIGVHYAALFPWAIVCLHQAQQHKVINDRNNEKHGTRVAMEVVITLLQKRKLGIFSSGHRPNVVAKLAVFIQISRSAVVDGVIVTPLPVGSKVQKTKNITDKIPDGGRLKSSAVPAIVHDHKHSDEKAAI